MPFTFDNTYARLPERFYARVSPTPVRDPRILKVNHPLASWLGIDPSRLDSAQGARWLAGNAIPEGADPIALAYAGHQFGGFVPQLGDGRAILLGEVVTPDGARRDVQLKGAGRTPFSRGGDGRAAIGPVLREFILSEAMAALGVPTTRALAAVTTGEPVIRDLILPGAVFTRVAASHIRVGTFELFASREDRDAVARLTAYAVARHFPRAAAATPGDLASDALHLLECVLEAHASLVARWLGVGFIHGVMNTDNTSISGETLDYGPCAFLDAYSPTKTFSSIDHRGRYAFANQPRAAEWNLARFAETLLPLLADDQDDAIRLATERLERFPRFFAEHHDRVMRAKLGLGGAGDADDPADTSMIADLLERLASSRVDYTVFFRALCSSAEDPASDLQVASLFEHPAAFHGWAEGWRARLRRDPTPPRDRAKAMRRANPAFIPRNHRVEEAIVAATVGDLRPFETLVRVLARPYDEQPADRQLADPPRPEERVEQTFCGT
jgi:uncharacterized protein YdiU (UPF0061 family)